MFQTDPPLGQVVEGRVSRLGEVERAAPAGLIGYRGGEAGVRSVAAAIAGISEPGIVRPGLRRPAVRQRRAAAAAVDWR